MNKALRLVIKPKKEYSSEEIQEVLEKFKSNVKGFTEYLTVRTFSNSNEIILEFSFPDGFVFGVELFRILINKVIDSHNMRRYFDVKIER